MDIKVILFIIAWLLIAILLLWHVKRRVKKYKVLLGDNYERLINKIGKSNLSKDTQDKKPPDNIAPKK